MTSRRRTVDWQGHGAKHHHSANKYTVKDLRDAAKEHEIPRYYKLTKAELIDALVDRGQVFPEHVEHAVSPKPAKKLSAWHEYVMSRSAEQKEKGTKFGKGKSSGLALFAEQWKASHPKPEKVPGVRGRPRTKAVKFGPVRKPTAYRTFFDEQLVRVKDQGFSGKAALAQTNRRWKASKE